MLAAQFNTFWGGEQPELTASFVVAAVLAGTMDFQRKKVLQLKWKSQDTLWGLSRMKIICAMDADPERVLHSLLAQVQDYANCKLFPEQQARSTILHCMQARLLSIAGSLPICAGPVWGSQETSRAREQGVETGDSGWKSVLIRLDLQLALVAVGNGIFTPWSLAAWESSLAQIWCNGSTAGLWLWIGNKEHCSLELSPLNFLIFHVIISCLRNM